MKRALGLISLLLALGACVAGSWLAIRPPLAPFLAPTTTDIQVVNMSIWEQQISYQVAGPPYAWYWATIHTLEEQHWTLLTELRPDLSGLTYNPIMSLRFERTSFGFLEEEVMLDPDRGNPNLARIRVSRRITIPWREFFWRPQLTQITRSTTSSVNVARKQ
jgi:hypothetical protein